MPMWLKASGLLGSLLALITVVIVFRKTIIGFIAFLTGALKILIVVVFILLIVGVGLAVLTRFRDARRGKE